MNTQDFEKLAISTAHWLAEKRVAKFDLTLISESFLIIPIAEFLIPQWDVKGEFSFGSKGIANYDLLAKQGPETLLFETKLLKFARPKKSSSDQKPVLISQSQRIFKDFVKLALPNDANYQRIALVASTSENKISVSIEKIIEDKKCIFEFDAPAYTFMRDDEGKKVPCFTGKNLEYVQTWCKTFQFKNFTVKLEADKSKDGFRVVIFSVHLPSTAPVE